MYTNTWNYSKKTRVNRLSKGEETINCMPSRNKTEDIQTNIENDNYNIWRKDRKGKKGDGVMIMIESKIYVINVEYGKGKEELISAQIETQYRENKKKLHINCQKNKNLRNNRKYYQRVTLVGDFNCSDIK